MKMKYLNYLFVPIFILFAAVQYNDPDPYLWIPIYLYPAALCFLATRDKFSKPAYLAGFVFFGAYACYKLFDENGVIDWLSKHQATNIAGTMKAAAPWIEETREFFGLLIILAILLINYIYYTKQKNTIPAN